MAENKFEQNNFRDGIMSNGMTGRNETELYQRSVYSIIDGMPTPFGSIKNKTIFSDPQVGGFNEPLAGNDINWEEIFLWFFTAPKHWKMHNGYFTNSRRYFCIYNERWS